MALGGIGAGGGSPLERFQQLRDTARRKMEAPEAVAGEGDGRARLAELLKRKQAELGGVGGPAQGADQAKARARAGRIAAELPGADARPEAQGTQGYGRAGSAEKSDMRPKLGRYIDFMA